MLFFKKIKNEYFKYKELIWELAKTDLKLKYTENILGYAWSILQPLLMFSVMYIIFSNFRGLNHEHFALQLIVSLALFQFFSEGAKSGMISLAKKRNLITKISLPKWTIIFSSTVHSIIVFGLNLIILVIFFAINKMVPTISDILLFFLFSILIYIIILGYSFLTAPLFIKFKDVSIIHDVLFRILFYASGVFFTISMLPANIQRILMLNPIAYMIHYLKIALTSSEFPPLSGIVMMSIRILIFFIISSYIFKKTNKKIMEFI